MWREMDVNRENVFGECHRNLIKFKLYYLDF